MNFSQPNTILCKPMVTISGQHFLKFEIHNTNLTSSFTRQIPALVKVLPLNAVLKIIYLKHKLQQPNTSLCKPIVTSSCQQFLKFEIHNSNLTSSFTWQILALVRVLPLNAMLEVIYLKHKLQTAKHLVSLDAYNLVIATTITEAFSEFIKFKYFQLLVTSILSKLIYFMQSLSY